MCSINHVSSFTCKAFTHRMRFIVQIICAKKNRRVFSHRMRTSCCEATIFLGGVMLTTSAAMADKIIICASQHPVFTNHQSVGLVRVVVAPLSHMRPWHLQMSLELSNHHPKIHLEPTLEQFQLLSQEVNSPYLVVGGATQSLRTVLSKTFSCSCFWLQIHVVAGVRSFDLNTSHPNILHFLCQFPFLNLVFALP